MLIYSKEPLNVMMKNILLLDDPFTGGYVYVSKETFEQALSLKITYNEDVGRVKGTISGKGMLNWAANKAVSHVVSLCSEKFVSPINMLAPYLAYTLPIGIEWPEEDDEAAIKMAYGVLHQMSQFINFYGTALMPSGAKADITIPKNIIMAYEDSWNAQLETLDKCVVAVPVYVSGGAVVESQQTPVEEVQSVKTETAVSETVKVDTPNEEPIVSAKSIEESAEQETLIVDDNVVEDAIEAVTPEHEDTGNESTPQDANDGDDSYTDGEDDGSGSSDGEDDEDDDLEARILAMMKQIEEAPAEEFQKGDTKADDVKTTDVNTERAKEEVKFGESGSINMTEKEIAAGNRKLLEDYDI